jgi:hypothetical protein
MKMNEDGLEDMVLIGNIQYTVGVPYNYSRQLKEKILTAINSEFIGLKTLDRLYKQIQKRSHEFDKGANFNWFYEKTSQIKTSAFITSEKIRVGPNVTLPFNMFLSLATLLRVTASINSLRYLILNGYYFESFSIMRLIFEQIAYANKLSKVSESEVAKVIPTRCINDLKAVIPNAVVLYGRLSEVTHIDFQKTQEFFGVNEETGEMDADIVVMRSPKNNFEMLFQTFVILDVYDLVTEWVFREYLDKYESWVKIDGKLRPKDERNNAKIAEEIKKEWLRPKPTKPNT